MFFFSVSTPLNIHFNWQLTFCSTKIFSLGLYVTFLKSRPSDSMDQCCGFLKIFSACWAVNLLQEYEKWVTDKSSVFKNIIYIYIFFKSTFKVCAIQTQQQYIHTKNFHTIQNQQCTWYRPYSSRPGTKCKGEKREWEGESCGCANSWIGRTLASQPQC